MSIKLKDTILDYIDKAYKDGSGNTISSTYLPLSGGVITGRLHLKGALLSFQNTDGSFNGYLGSSSYNLRWYKDDAWHTIIHSGNIGSQSVNYATSSGNSDTVDGYHASSFLRYGSNIFSTTVKLKSTNSWTRVCNISDDGLAAGVSCLVNIRSHYNSTVHNTTFLVTSTYSNRFDIMELSNRHYSGVKIRIGSDDNYGSPLSIDIASKSSYAANSTYFVYIILLQKISSITEVGTQDVSALTYSKEAESHPEGAIVANNFIGNASSATKLQTARTIWGQSFDGTGNVDGLLTLNYNNSSRATGIEVVSTNGGEASIGFKLNSSTRAVVGCWSDALNLWRADCGTCITIPQSGNVGIGTTNPSYKLDVNGTFGVRGTTYCILPSAGADAIYYSERTDLGKTIGFGIGTSNNRGIYDYNLGWIFKVDPDNAITIGNGNNVGFNGSVIASGFIKSGSSSAYVLTGDGGHKAISDFATSGHTHSYAGSNTSSGKAYDLYGHSGNPGSHNDVGVRWFTVSSTSSGNSGYAGTNAGFPVSNNANGILWLGNHSGAYGGQLGISSNGRLYYRFISAGSFPTTANGGSWNRIAWTNDLNSYALSSHTHSYLPLSGGTMTGTIRMGSSDVIFSGSDPGDLVWYDGNGNELHRLWHDSNGSLAYRSQAGTIRALLHSGNYTDYTVTKTGGGASGTWGISISGNAASAGSSDSVDGHHFSTVTSLPSSPNSNTVYFVTG